MSEQKSNEIISSGEISESLPIGMDLKIPDQFDSPPAKEELHGLAKALGIWILPFTRFHRIPVFKRVWLYLAFMFGYVWIVDWFVDQNFPSRVFREAGTAAYGSVILGLLLVFRTNSAYERWSEGRRLWGQLVNDSRNLCLKLRANQSIPYVEKIHIGELVISFAYALKHHLRDSRPTEALPGIGKANTQQAKNLPVYIASVIYNSLIAWHQKGMIDGFNMLQIDRHARAFMDVCGACERIRNSPLAVSYRAFMRQGIALNLLAMPWYVAPEVSLWWSIPIILISAYFLIGLELIAEDIEDPFGHDGDDLPLDNICANIRSSISDILDVQETQRYTASYKAPRLDPLKDRI